MLRFLWTYSVTFFYILLLKKNLKEDPRENVSIGMKISEKALKSAGYKILILGRENLPTEDGVLYVSNHQSFFDIFASLFFIQKQLGFVAKKQLENFFSVGYYVRKMGGVLIDRDDVRSQVDVIVKLTKNIKEGLNVFIFPEGTRTKTGQLAEFKSGSFKIAIKTNCTVVPITFYDNHIVSTNRGDGIIKVKIDKPIRGDEYKGMTTSELSQKVETQIQENLNKGFDFNSAVELV
ncbi:MAG: 1-acyl-sn-glycerol-3-phosphate acyltransferase [Leptospiraceae bacterium]|nr:1-acyl-sn-glycerol-3-phosphate acyltransferase [Leptospiraceae bacterium]MCP5512712.1 1-acyl-sn-glycerol-3-phosphate acyltransferase [Leptospiraceae bacterium]